MLKPPVHPMLAKAVESLPPPGALPGGCVYEPKIDGYRALVFRSERGTAVQSRRGPLITRSFPEIERAGIDQLAAGTVLDGELAILGDDGALDFSALQQRYGATSRAADLARSKPANFIAFDILAAEGRDVRRLPFSERRELLEKTLSSARPPLQLCPQTSEASVAQEWFDSYKVKYVGLEGLVIKGRAEPYRPGRRGWLKLRVRQSADAVAAAVLGTVDEPDRLVLGRYDDAGELRLVGGTTPLSPEQVKQVKPSLRRAPPGHPWPGSVASGRIGIYGSGKLDLTLVEPFVVEVSADNAVDGGRWRNMARFVRVRHDVEPAAVTM